jgi:hypothetical protein
MVTQRKGHKHDINSLMKLKDPSTDATI